MQRLQRVDPGQPRMRRATRAVVAAALAAGAAVVLSTAGAPVAGALTRDPLVISADGEASATYPGIPGNNPSSQAADPTPHDCGDVQNASQFTVACDVVPLKILVPNVSEADDFVVEIELTWEPADEIDGVGGVNDLDMYLYDNQQIAKRDDPESSTYTQFGRSTSFEPPERISIYRPELGDYNLVVNNFSGPNVSYTVKARIKIGTFEAPFEALGPGGPVSEPVEDGSGEVAPMDYSADEPTSNSFSSPPAMTAAPVLGEVAVLPDQDFSEFDAGSSFDDQLRQAEQQALPAGLVTLRPPKPVPAAVLLFWFVLAPAAVLGPVALLIARRNRSRLGAA
jgi:hypothetical protein